MIILFSYLADGADKGERSLGGLLIVGSLGSLLRLLGVSLLRLNLLLSSGHVVLVVLMVCCLQRK